MLAAAAGERGRRRPAAEASPGGRQLLAEIDRRGIIATPANSSINELVTEAARLSIAAGGRRAVIDYGGTPGVRLGP